MVNVYRKPEDSQENWNDWKLERNENFLDKTRYT